jgi:glycerophosphoryl diester phosphodiesterase
VILVHGHRGARAVYPENTVAGFQYAIDIGADLLEMDVVVTKDHAPVISHDPRINPTICSGPQLGVAIQELTLAELGQYDCGARKNPRFPKQRTIPGARIPTLAEVLRLGEGNRVQFNIEIKSFPNEPELTPEPEVFSKLVLDVIRRQKLESRVIVQSFDFRILHAVKRLATEIRLAALWEGAVRPFLDIAQEAGTAIVAPEFHQVSPERVRPGHAANLQVIPWTPNRAEDWQPLIDAEVDAIITDDPAELIAYLKQRGLR